MSADGDKMNPSSCHAREHISRDVLSSTDKQRTDALTQWRTSSVPTKWWFWCRTEGKATRNVTSSAPPFSLSQGQFLTSWNDSHQILQIYEQIDGSSWIQTNTVRLNGCLVRREKCLSMALACSSTYLPSKTFVRERAINFHYRTSRRCTFIARQSDHSKQKLWHQVLKLPWRVHWDCWNETRSVKAMSTSLSDESDVGQDPESTDSAAEVGPAHSTERVMHHKKQWSLTFFYTTTTLVVNNNHVRWTMGKYRLKQFLHCCTAKLEMEWSSLEWKLSTKSKSYIKNCGFNPLKKTTVKAPGTARWSVFFNLPTNILIL